MDHRQKERRRKREQKRRRTGLRDPDDRIAEPSNVRLLHYEIVHEPLTEVEEANRSLDASLDPDERERLFDQVGNDPTAAIPRLLELLEQHPGTPLLYNWLAVAYGRVGQRDKADEMVRLNFEHNPDYFFARINVAQRLLEQGDVEGAERVMDNKFDLKLLYPERNAFHVTEYLAMAYVAVMYYCKRGLLDPAVSVLKTMEQVAPDAPQTQMAGAKVNMASLKLAAKRLANMVLRRGRLP